MEKVVEMSVENGFRSLDKRIELKEWTFKVVEGTGSCLLVFVCCWLLYPFWVHASL